VIVLPAFPTPSYIFLFIDEGSAVFPVPLCSLLGYLFFAVLWLIDSIFSSVVGVDLSTLNTPHEFKA